MWSRVNYTTYDVRRDYDTINPSRYAFVMVKSPETGSEVHPYWYAQVLDIYHADVQRFGAGSTDIRPRAMHFLWVRWLGDEPGWNSGRKFARLPKIGFVPDTDDYAFGFLDPSVVIRGVHLLPDFCGGRTMELLQTMATTIARKTEEEEDWVNYYVNIHGGTGHLGTGLSPLLENLDEIVAEDENDEEEDLLFLSSADFERELDEEDEYEVGQRPTEDEDMEEDEDEAENDDDDVEEGREDDQEEDIDYEDNGYDDY
ncbi:hypothetical protein EDD85DRAFT_919171 [Armillaria nabsnona]|nr:hypothetical protein EDD85DRAFT_919171 [Armillaria nabsnona]